LFLLAGCCKNKRKTTSENKAKKCAPNANNDKTPTEAAAEVAKCRQTNSGSGQGGGKNPGGDGTQKWQNKSTLHHPPPTTQHPFSQNEVGAIYFFVFDFVFFLLFRFVDALVVF